MHEAPCCISSLLPSLPEQHRQHRTGSSAKQPLKWEPVSLQVLLQLLSCCDLAFSDALGGWQQLSQIPVPNGVSYRAHAGVAVTFL